MQPALIMTSCEKIEDAEKIATDLLKTGLVACVQISSAVKSRYMWQGELVKAKEFIVSMKSSQEQFEKLQDKISKSHPYDVPEIISINISNISTPYLRWLEQELDV